MNDISCAAKEQQHGSFDGLGWYFQQCCDEGVKKGRLSIKFEQARMVKQPPKSNGVMYVQRMR
jgi:hypothetical protein